MLKQHLAYEVMHAIVDASCSELKSLDSVAAAPAHSHKYRALRWEEAVTRAEAAAEQSWPSVCSSLRSSRRDKLIERNKFETIQSEFLNKHGQDIRKSLQQCFAGPITLRPAPLAPEVREHFLTRYTNIHALRPALHGTKASNHESIFARGLLIPGAGNQVTIAHGASHGLGIYTAKLSNPFLSRGFCSAPRMLVCGIVDDAVQQSQLKILGRFAVTAESESVRHVGDAIVVFDPWRVVPLFEASATGFVEPTPAESRPNAQQQQSRSVSSTCKRVGVAGKKHTLTTTTTLTTGAVRRSTSTRTRIEKQVSQGATSARRFLMRRAALKRRAKTLHRPG